jgi:hypothetical protein
MTVNAQGEWGIIEIKCDFTGEEKIIVNTNDSWSVGPFILGGEGIEDNDAGATIMDTTPNLGGVLRLIGSNEDLDTTALMTGMMFDVALMGPIFMECRVQTPDLDDKAFFIGFNDVCTRDVSIVDVLDSSTGTTLGIAASDVCGFSLSSQLTEDEMWHCPFAGGTAATETVSTNVESGVDAVLSEWQLLRLEIDPNGTARWYIDNALVQTKEGAVSTTTDLGFMMASGANTTQFVHLDVDYIIIRAGRDWNA